MWRQDFAGAWIRRDAYGTHTQYGWEIDHLRPISKGGTNEIENLTVLHWRNNLRKKNNKWEYMPNYELSVSISKDNQSYIFALKKARNHPDGRDEAMADFFNCLPEELLISFIIDFNEEIFKYSNFKIFNRNCKLLYRSFNLRNYIFYTVSIKSTQPIIVSNLQVDRPTSAS